MTAEQVRREFDAIVSRSYHTLGAGTAEGLHGGTMTPDEYAQNELDKQRRIGPVNDSFVWTSPNGVDHHAYYNRPCATCGRVHLPNRTEAAQQARDLVQVIGLTYAEYDDLKVLARALPPTSSDPKGDDLL